MQASIFLKYPEYKKGLRFVIDGHTFSIEYNKDRKMQDEVFDGTFCSLMKLQVDLKRRFGEKEGQRWFTHLFQHIFHYHIRRIRKKRKRT